MESHQAEHAAEHAGSTSNNSDGTPHGTSSGETRPPSDVPRGRPNIPLTPSQSGSAKDTHATAMPGVTASGGDRRAPAKTTDVTASGGDVQVDDGVAMPAKKKQAMLAPAMPVLPPRPYADSDPHTPKDWISQLPLCMVAQLVPSKLHDTMEVNGKTARQAILEEWENLARRGCWDAKKARPHTGGHS